MLFYHQLQGTASDFGERAAQHLKSFKPRIGVATTGRRFCFKGVGVLFLVTFMFSHFYKDFHKWVIDLVGFTKGDNKSTQDHWEVLTLVVITVGVLLLFLKVSRATGIFLEYIYIL